MLSQLSDRKNIPPVWPQLIGMLSAVMQNDNSESRIPSPQLSEPLSHDGCWADNQGRLEHIAAVQPCKEDCQLYSLPKPHFIPNDAPRSLSVQLPHPLHTCNKPCVQNFQAWLRSYLLLV